ncbi:hypothetical protein [Nocardiopsis sp. CC223A]|uniref:hypothetical protein n=1 Tax=Nocardiopsis sp. CC223A TaxID=3044051 RepID=UPI0027955998|nr:hypothetical protein [Nocardiopsis sp. CC223A]
MITEGGAESQQFEDRSLPIEEVETGDEVLATDPETGEQLARTVLATIVGSGSKVLVEITIDPTTERDAPEGETVSAGVVEVDTEDAGIPGPVAVGDVVIATDEPPFWVPDLKAWVDAIDLVPGMWLQTSAGTWVQINAVHNLTVQGVHTYHVATGSLDVLNHNCNDINLGLNEVDGDNMALADFSDRVGASHYRDWSSEGDDWVREFKDYAADGETNIHFNLDGIDDPVAWADRGAGLGPIFDGHATAWELSVIRDSPSALSRNSFYRRGSRVENPFS